MSDSEYVRYCAGFLMYNGQVLLLRKNRPAWQAGKLNGIGGHVEPGETLHEAMRREFLEEAGVDVPAWEHFATVRGNAWGEVAFFRSFADEETFNSTLLGPVDEGELGIYWIREAPYLGALPNLLWLLPLAWYQHDTYQPLIAEEIAS